VTTDSVSGGLDDPHLTLLRIDVTSGAFWESPGGLLQVLAAYTNVVDRVALSEVACNVMAPKTPDEIACAILTQLPYSLARGPSIAVGKLSQARSGSCRSSAELATVLPHPTRPLSNTVTEMPSAAKVARPGRL
jgi:hypothetical protein